MKNRKNGIHSNQQLYSSGWDNFPDAKGSVMKYCSSVVISDIDAYYLYHMGDEFRKAFDVVWLVW